MWFLWFCFLIWENASWPNVNFLPIKARVLVLFYCVKSVLVRLSIIRLEKSLINWTMVCLRSIWWLILGSWLLCLTNSGWMELSSVLFLSWLFSTTENTTSLDFSLVVVSRVYSSTVRLLTRPSCFWYISRVCTSNFWQNVPTRRIRQFRPMSCWCMCSIRGLVGIFNWLERPFGSTWTTWWNIRISLMFPAHRQQNIRSWAWTPFCRVRTLCCEWWNSSSYLAWCFKFALLVRIGVVSYNVFRKRIRTYRLVKSLISRHCILNLILLWSCNIALSKIWW